MKKIAWFNGNKMYMVLVYKRWYIRLPFLRPAKGIDYPVIWSATKPEWFGKLPVMFTSEFIIAPYVAQGKILPIVYRREK